MPCSSAPRTARATCWAFWPRISGTIQNLYLRTVFPTVTAWLLFVVLVACLGWFSLWLALAMLLVLGTAVFLVPAGCRCWRTPRARRATSR